MLRPVPVSTPMFTVGVFLYDSLYAVIHLFSLLDDVDSFDELLFHNRILFKSIITRKLKQILDHSNSEGVYKDDINSITPNDDK